MKLHVFSIYDSAAGLFNNPMFFRSRAEAVRSFDDAVNREGSDFARHSLDYVMFMLGTFDMATGVFETAPPERVIGAVECIAKDK